MAKQSIHALIEQPEHLRHEAGAVAVDAGGAAGLAQVLAGKAGGDEVDVAGQVRELAHVRRDGDGGKAVEEDAARRRPHFAQERGLVAALGEAGLQPEKSSPCEHAESSGLACFVPFMNREGGIANGAV